MPYSPYVTVRLNGNDLQIPQAEELPVAITYEIEDEDDFRQKKSATALDITVPATTQNSSSLNGIQNSGSVDLLPDDGFDKPMSVAIIAAGNELFAGKAFLIAGRSQNGQPIEYDINCFGDNADWVIPNKELTLSEALSISTHTFDKETIEESWFFDGSSEEKDFVYAPFRSREPFGDPFGDVDANNKGMIFRPVNARPSLSLYWMLWRGFKKAGYKIQSSFFDTEYFRRLVLPWTWGNFFYITDKLLKEMQFCATGPVTANQPNPGVSGTPFSWQFENLGGYTGSSIVDDYAHFVSGHNRYNFQINNVTTDIGYIGTPACYSYDDANGIMQWEYLPIWAALGLITVAFSVKMSASIDVSFNSNCTIWYEISKNGTVIDTVQMFYADAPGAGTATDHGTQEYFFEVTDLAPGDTVSVRIKYHCFKSGTGYCYMKIYATGNQLVLNPTGVPIPEDVRSYFQMNYIRRQLGSIIDWSKYDKFKNYLWLDLLRGTIDMFNLQMNTDPKTRTVVIEPTHAYSLDNDPANTNEGYYNGNVLDWSEKEDISKVSEVRIFQDYEREVVIQLKADDADGILKLMQDRHQSNLTQTKYLFPERFKKGNKEIENRFFSGVMHYEHQQWKDITGIAPQMICLIPENISNTSAPESEYTFGPKLAWYKGTVKREIYGGWNWDGDDSLEFPFMFAVNYKNADDSDPALTYIDQRIGDDINGFTHQLGLFKRFFWQRFAVMRHGRIYRSNYLLNTTDVMDRLHREYIAVNGQRYQLRKIENYKPLLNETTSCEMWRWYPVTSADNSNTYPTNDSVMTEIPVPNTPDFIYQRMICLPADIPNE